MVAQVPHTRAKELLLASVVPSETGWLEFHARQVSEDGLPDDVYEIISVSSR